MSRFVVNRILKAVLRKIQPSPKNSLISLLPFATCELRQESSVEYRNETAGIITGSLGEPEAPSRAS